ncbi:MAG: VanW family protein [Polyangiaceae bacterium]|nr:VanW family protein [Polyangiaceae bacterium]
MRNLLLRAGLVLAAGCAATTGAYAGARHAFPSGRSLPGTWIGDAVQPSDEPLEAWLARRAAAAGAREAWLATDRGWVRTSWAELGIELDVESTAAAARGHARAGAPLARAARAWRARRGRERLDPIWRVDRAVARAAVERVAPLVRRDPVDARLDLTAHRRVDEEPGAVLDVEGTIAALERLVPADLDEPLVVEVATASVPAGVTSAMLAAVDPSVVLSQFETSFGGTGRGRAVNIARAAAYLDGTVLAPGARFSFNETVGARTIERGFTWAPVIRDDELEPGIGGGVCQVASTVHAAAVYGGLEVLARRSHSRPSSYTRLGLDATVIWGEVDLVLRNPHPAPVIVHAYLSTPTTLRVELLGAPPPAKVEYSYGVARTHDFYRRVTTKPWMRDRTLKRQRGIRGLDVVSVVRVILADGRAREHRYFSEYRPVPEVFWVGPDAAPAGLPELPEGAVRVEVDGAEQRGAFLAAGAPDRQGT